MIRVTFTPASVPDDISTPFVRTFPDMETWERVRAALRWTYTRMQVEQHNEETGAFEPVPEREIKRWQDVPAPSSFGDE